MDYNLSFLFTCVFSLFNYLELMRIISTGLSTEHLSTVRSDARPTSSTTENEMTKMIVCGDRVQMMYYVHMFIIKLEG